MIQNLIGKKLTFKSFFQMTSKLETAEMEVKRKAIQKEKKYERSFFLTSGVIEGITSAGEGMSLSPCLIVSNAKFVNKEDKKKLFIKSNASILLTYVFFDQIISIDKK